MGGGEERRAVCPRVLLSGMMTAAIPTDPGITARFRSQATIVVAQKTTAIQSAPRPAAGMSGSGVTFSGGYQTRSMDDAQGEGRRIHEFDMLQDGPVLNLRARLAVPIA